MIPEGNYGAGAMILWDRGAYAILDGKSPADALQAGKLDLALFGHKMSGRWALVRLAKSETGRDWLLFKKKDAIGVETDLVDRFPTSVVSGLRVDQRGDPSDHTEPILESVKDAGASLAPLGRADLAPMLARSRKEPFSDPDWLYEIKYDGVRALLAREHDGSCHLLSRNGRDYAERFPEIALVGRYLPFDTFAVDGEIIAVEESGAGSFELVQSRLGGRPDSSVQVVMYAFDLLHLGGYDLRPLPLVERKRILRDVLPALGPVRYSDHVVADGERLFEAARERHLEGVVAKRAASTYRSGQRSNDWLKIKLPRTDHLAILGWVPGKGSRPIGSLLLGWLVDGDLRYAGNVGSGLDANTCAHLEQVFASSGIDEPSFSYGGLAQPSGASFVEPTQVATVRYTDVTRSGALRHPVFVGLAPDADWRDCSAPAALQNPAPVDTCPADDPPAGTTARWSPSNLDKVFWPGAGYTKGDLLGYYESVWPYIGPYLNDRPLTLSRHPDGIEGKSFFQKHAPDFLPDWIDTAMVDDTRYIVCNHLDALLYVINLGCIPLHIGAARISKLDHPDWTVLDLDPKGAPFVDVVRVARRLHHLLDDLQLPHYVKSSGQTGLHILLPMPRSATHEQAKMLAEVVARVAAAELPAIATVARPLQARHGKVYVDFLQNGRGKTIAAPLCVRPVPEAPVSMPLRWSQVTKRLDPKRFTITTTPRRLRRSGDPMAHLLQQRVDRSVVMAALEKLQTRLGAGQ